MVWMLLQWGCGSDLDVLRKWIRTKKDIPAHQIGWQWKFKRSELDKWVDSGKSTFYKERLR